MWTLYQYNQPTGKDGGKVGKGPGEGVLDRVGGNGRTESAAIPLVDPFQYELTSVSRVGGRVCDLVYNQVD